MKKPKANTRPFWRLLFLCYCAGMLWLLFLGTRSASYGNYWAQVRENYSIRPFYTINNYLRVLLHSSNGYLVRHCAINLAGNILLFVPGGFLFPRLFRTFRPFWRALLLFFFMLLCVETVQLFSLRGRFDVDDLILNLLGLCVGYGIYALRK